MFELTIDGEVYEFKFGVGFVREINKKTVIPTQGLPGAMQEVGFQFEVAKVIDGDVVALVDMLEIANKGMKPRVTTKKLEEYIDNEADIDELFTQVIGFLSEAAATKSATQKMKAAMTPKEQ